MPLWAVILLVLAGIVLGGAIALVWLSVDLVRFFARLFGRADD